MNINNQNKLHELSLYTNMNLNNINKDSNMNIKNHKSDDNSSTNIARIKRKASIMNYHQRELQGRITDIQTQEAKIYEMEKSLESAKQSYSEKLKNEKKETTNIKVKIKQLYEKEDELKLKSDKEIKANNKYDQHKDEEIISTIEETLKKIEKVKNQIYIYKSKLMSLEHRVEQAVSKLESNKALKDKDFIQSELNFISIEENIETGLIINIET